MMLSRACAFPLWQIVNQIEQAAIGSSPDRSASSRVLPAR
jgi:hypothetical protein